MTPSKRRYLRQCREKYLLEAAKNFDGDLVVEDERECVDYLLAFASPGIPLACCQAPDVQECGSDSELHSTEVCRYEQSVYADSFAEVRKVGDGLAPRSYEIALRQLHEQRVQKLRAELEETRWMEWIANESRT